MAAKVNFTKEHLSKLKELVIKTVMANKTIQGTVGQVFTAQDLLFNCTINTLESLHSNLKKQVEKISDASNEWTSSEYEQRKLSALKEQQELVNYCIGYRKFREQQNSERTKLNELKRKQEELKESTMTPEDKLKAIQAEIDSITVDEDLD